MENNQFAVKIYFYICHLFRSTDFYMHIQVEIPLKRTVILPSLSELSMPNFKFKNTETTFLKTPAFTKRAQNPRMWMFLQSL